MSTPTPVIAAHLGDHILYKFGITNPTKENIENSKSYNNKLNSIKRKAERDHFGKQLEIKKSDIKKSWKIMKSVIGSKRKYTQKVSSFNINSKNIINEQHIANEFNNYFISVDPTLAENYHQQISIPLNLYDVML